MITKPVSLFLLLAFAAVGVAADSARQSQQDNIREAVFRWEFGHNGSYQQEKAKVFFLVVGENDSDPSDEFVKRFADNNPPVRKGSECSSSPRKGVLDKKTGERGLIFRVGSIVWKSDTEVEVDGSWHEGGLSAGGHTYTLKKETDKWKVTNDKMGWVA
jgi:hypothetical protein